MTEIDKVLQLHSSFAEMLIRLLRNDLDGWQRSSGWDADKYIHAETGIILRDDDYRLEVQWPENVKLTFWQRRRFLLAFKRLHRHIKNKAKWAHVLTGSQNLIIFSERL